MKLSNRFPIAALFALALVAQQASPQAPAAGRPPVAAPAAETPLVFTSNAILIVETVSVKDKDGKPVEGLKKEDFVVTEDNKPQQVYYLEYQKFDDTPITETSEVKPTFKPAAAGQIEPDKPGSNTMKYQNRRLLSMYFDMQGMPDIDQIRALSSAQSFIKKNLQAADLVSIMVFSDGAVNVKQDFTDDREVLLQVIDKIALAAQGFEVDNSDAGSAFGQDTSEFNIFNTDHQLAAVQTAVQMLGRVTGKKSMLYFASGLSLSGLDNQAQMQSLSNAAIRNNVTINPVDARGLVALSMGGGGSGGGGMGLYTGAVTSGISGSFNKSQDALYAMAADTGGKAFFDNNDLSKGIVNVQQSVTSYYVLSYFTTNGTLDGKLRRVKIAVNKPDLKLEYRQAYYAGKTYDKFTSTDKERQLEEALMQGDPITDLPIAVEVNYFQLNRAEYFIPVNVKIPGSELVLAKRGGAQHTVIELIGEIKDEYGLTLTNLREKFDIPLNDANAAQISTTPLMYDGAFTTLPGKNFTIKVLVRDDETGRIGTFISKFDIPNLLKEEKRLPISSVVLSSQRSDMKETLVTAKSKIAAQSPLIENGFKLVPNVTHVFSRSKEMFVYLQAYQRGNTTTETEPIIAFVSLYKGQVKVFETQPVQVKDGFDPKSASKAVPIRLSFPMAQLAPGRYECQVTVLDPTNQKAAFWQAPIVLVP